MSKLFFKKVTCKVANAVAVQPSSDCAYSHCVFMNPKTHDLLEQPPYVRLSNGWIYRVVRTAKLHKNVIAYHRTLRESLGISVGDFSTVELLFHSTMDEIRNLQNLTIYANDCTTKKDIDNLFMYVRMMASSLSVVLTDSESLLVAPPQDKPYAIRTTLVVGVLAPETVITIIDKNGNIHSVNRSVMKRVSVSTKLDEKHQACTPTPTTTDSATSPTTPAAITNTTNTNETQNKNANVQEKEAEACKLDLDQKTTPVVPTPSQSESAATKPQTQIVNQDQKEKGKKPADVNTKEKGDDKNNNQPQPVPVDAEKDLEFGPLELYKKLEMFGPLELFRLHSSPDSGCFAYVTRKLLQLITKYERNHMMTGVINHAIFAVIVNSLHGETSNGLPKRIFGAIGTYENLFSKFIKSHEARFLTNLGNLALDKNWSEYLRKIGDYEKMHKLYDIQKLILMSVIGRS